MVRVGIFTDSYRPYFSGVIRALELFRAEFRRLAHQTYVFAPDYRGTSPEPDVFRFRSVRAITFPSYNLAIPISPYLRQRVRSLRLDVIHAHSPFLLGPAGARCARYLDLPLVFTYHTMYEQYLHYAPFGEKMWEGVLKRVVRDFCNRSDVVIAPSSGLARLIKDRGVTSQVEVIPTGISLEQFSRPRGKMTRAQLGIPSEAPLLITVGRVGEEKNPQMLMEAFHLVQKTHPEAHLLMVGDGPMKDGLLNWSRERGISDKVHFTGGVSPEAVTDLYHLSDIFVFTSQTETQGLVVLEAKACGLPVISLRNLSSEDLIRTHPSKAADGFIVEKTSPGEFAATIEELLDNTHLRRAMSENARRNAVAFSSRAWAKRIESLYVDLIKGREGAVAGAGSTD